MRGTSLPAFSSTISAASLGCSSPDWLMKEEPGTWHLTEGMSRAVQLGDDRGDVVVGQLIRLPILGAGRSRLSLWLAVPAPHGEQLVVPWH